MCRQHFTGIDAYKERIYQGLLELLPKRMARLDHGAFEGKTTEEVLALVYMQGVAEALDAFDLNEMLQALEDDDEAGLQA